MGSRLLSMTGLTTPLIYRSKRVDGMKEMVRLNTMVATTSAAGFEATAPCAADVLGWLRV